MIDIMIGVVIGIIVAKKVPWIASKKLAFTKIVKFKDGKYGIRRGALGLYWYMDFHNAGHWPYGSSKWFDGDCKTDDLASLTLETDAGTPV